MDIRRDQLERDGGRQGIDNFHLADSQAARDAKIAALLQEDVLPIDAGNRLRHDFLVVNVSESEPFVLPAVPVVHVAADHWVLPSL